MIGGGNRVEGACAGSLALLTLFAVTLAQARDLDGKYAQSDLHSWFNSLASKKGMCCSLADGVTVKDVDWDTQDGKYRVRLDGQWIVVPDDALLTEQNKLGAAVVWPIKDDKGGTAIRCFIPGTLS